MLGNLFSGGASYRQGIGLDPNIFIRALPKALPLGPRPKK